MATETIVSPGVLLQEVDRSFITPGVDPSGLAIIGPAVKGPVEVPTLVNNYNEYKNIYGTTLESASNSFEYFTSVAVKNYFQNGGSTALVTRVVKTANNWAPASSSVIEAVSASDSSSNPFILETISKGTTANSAGGSGLLSNGALDSGSVDNVRWEITNLNKKVDDEMIKFSKIYLNDGRKNLSRTGSYFKKSYILEDLKICSKIQ